MKRLVLAASAATGLGLLTVSPMGADAAPPPAAAVAVAPEHGDYQNGCGPQGKGWLVPDSGTTQGVYWNFHDACDWHDVCYHYKRGKSYCDDGFHSRMRSWCVNRYDSWYERPARYVCYGQAYVYYKAVDWLGNIYY